MEGDKIKTNILIAGKSGVGKSSLLNYIFGEEVSPTGAGKPVTAAIIELKPDHPCTEEEIMAFCQKLPRYKRPHKIIFADIPRNPTGKIEKPKLRKIYCGESLVAKQNHG